MKAEGGQEGFTDHQPSSGRSQATHGETQELGQQPAVQECSVGTCGEENGGWELLLGPQGLGAPGGGGKTDLPSWVPVLSMPPCQRATQPHRVGLRGPSQVAELTHVHSVLGPPACRQMPLGLQGKPTPPSPVEPLWA